MGNQSSSNSTADEIPKDQNWLIIRHGSSCANLLKPGTLDLDKRIRSRLAPDSSLNGFGIDQAKKAANAVKAEKPVFEFTSIKLINEEGKAEENDSRKIIVCSPLQRTLQTAYHVGLELFGNGKFWIVPLAGLVEWPKSQDGGLLSLLPREDDNVPLQSLTDAMNNNYSNDAEDAEDSLGKHILDYKGPGSAYNDKDGSLKEGPGSKEWRQYRFADAWKEFIDEQKGMGDKLEIKTTILVGHHARIWKQIGKPKDGDCSYKQINNASVLHIADGKCKRIYPGGKKIKKISEEDAKELKICGNVAEKAILKKMTKNEKPSTSATVSPEGGGKETLLVLKQQLLDNEATAGRRNVEARVRFNELAKLYNERV